MIKQVISLSSNKTHYCDDICGMWSIAHVEENFLFQSRLYINWIDQNKKKKERKKKSPLVNRFFAMVNDKNLKFYKLSTATPCERDLKQSKTKIQN